MRSKPAIEFEAAVLTQVRRSRRRVKMNHIFVSGQPVLLRETPTTKLAPERELLSVVQHVAVQ